MRFSVCHVPNRLNSLVSVCLHSLRSYSFKTLSHYEVLGVSSKATRKEIKAAFIEKSKKLHPDRNVNDPKTHDKFIQLNEAYTTLSDPGLKSLYDARKGFMGRSSYTNHRSPPYNSRPNPVSQEYYMYEYNRNRTSYEDQQKEEEGIRKTGVRIFVALIGVYVMFFIFERIFKKANTIDVDYTNWIQNHHEAKAFRDKMYVQRILTDYLDTLDHNTQQTLRSFPRTTRYQILLEMYEEKMDKEAEERAKVRADKEEKAKNSEKDSGTEEITDDRTMTLNLVDLSCSSNPQPPVDTS
ncbi:hypothetical protein LOTGIDRAFT_235181 [Lottia gigantea]|uniref:J domain-containing protein n=1 Tax=Lottia gigantea TaxID=225164 RepID=V3Z7C5_LOTGI|nr:hypothetical protein LOTGIDRAFT_235181 [Lottia gigantea]ESO86748.1 hypothetical protein LOTGIDRAFT_235181 [Lottia gigantea]